MLDIINFDFEAVCKNILSVMWSLGAVLLNKKIYCSLLQPAS